jgi:hypothetical protein
VGKQGLELRGQGRSGVLARRWVSEFQSLPDLDANANAVAIEHIKLQNEGWARDPGTPQLDEPRL